MATKPTILILHGSWHQPAHFELFMEKLEAQGYPCVCPRQPTFNVPTSRMKSISMHQDAEHIRWYLDRLVEVEEKEVMVLCHSYGGIVGTQAVHESLGCVRRKAEGKKGGVVKMLYMSAFILPPNSSLVDAFGGGLPPFLMQSEDGSCILDNPRHLFYSGLDDETAKHYVALTRPYPTVMFSTPLTYSAYFHHPLAYLVCTQDAAINVDFQWSMIEACKAQGLDVDVHEIDADHSPWLTREAQTIDIIKKVASGEH